MPFTPQTHQSPFPGTSPGGIGAITEATLEQGRAIQSITEGILDRGQRAAFTKAELAFRRSEGEKERAARAYEGQLDRNLRAQQILQQIDLERMKTAETMAAKRQPNEMRTRFLDAWTSAEGGLSKTDKISPLMASGRTAESFRAELQQRRPDADPKILDEMVKKASEKREVRYATSPEALDDWMARTFSGTDSLGMPWLGEAGDEVVDFINDRHKSGQLYTSRAEAVDSLGKELGLLAESLNKNVPPIQVQLGSRDDLFFSADEGARGAPRTVGAGAGVGTDPFAAIRGQPTRPSARDEQVIGTAQFTPGAMKQLELDKLFPSDLYNELERMSATSGASHLTIQASEVPGAGLFGVDIGFDNRQASPAEQRLLDAVEDRIAGDASLRMKFLEYAARGGDVTNTEIPKGLQRRGAGGGSTSVIRGGGLPDAGAGVAPSSPAAQDERLLPLQTSGVGVPVGAEEWLRDNLPRIQEQVTGELRQESQGAEDAFLQRFGPNPKAEPSDRFKALQEQKRRGEEDFIRRQKPTAGRYGGSG